MISVEEAERIILELTPRTKTEIVPIEEASGRICAQDLATDRDLPPYDRVAMDGYAYFFQEDVLEFQIESMQRAGEARKNLASKTNCIEVMTGASLPFGCNSVIAYESTDKINDNTVVAHTSQLGQWKNIHRQGEDCKKNTKVIFKYQKLSALELGMAAAIGASKIQVFKRPRVAIVSTGDELVNIDQQPLEHQIRRSNEYAIAASMKAHGFIELEFFHLKDDLLQMNKKIDAIVDSFDYLIFSGGVSKGKFDLLPESLKSIGAKIHIHKVAQRPGKPLLLAHLRNTLVFGLPGNPASALTTFHRYVLKSLYLSMGAKYACPTKVSLANQVSFKKNLSYFCPVKLENQDGLLRAKSIATKGSGDFTSLLASDGFIELPANVDEFKEGQCFEFWSWR